MAKVKEFEIGPLRAVIFEHDSLGHLCGYLGLPSGHRLHGRHYDDDAVPHDVHGGWTYSEDHAPFEKSDGRWYLGFDCAHVWDLVPNLGSIIGDEVYRDEAYVESELCRAAASFISPEGAAA